MTHITILHLYHSYFTTMVVYDDETVVLSSLYNVRFSGYVGIVKILKPIANYVSSQFS